MPELPEVEVVKRSLNNKVQNLIIKKVKINDGKLRYYIDKKKWIAAINRFRNVTDNYDTTIYVEEALHRLVEVHYIIGLEEEAKKYANTLGYNYKSSEWYEKSYSIFNKIYEKNKNNKSKNKDKLSNSILKKFKSLFN